MGIAERAFSTDEDRRAYFEELRNRARVARHRPVLAVVAPVIEDWSKAETRKSCTIYQSPIGPVRKRDMLFLATRGVDPRPAQEILSAICLKYCVSMLELKSHRRARRLTNPRLEAYYRLREETALSFPQIGALIGNRDHSTVLHGARAFEQMVKDGRASL